jgi:hypothetical protein
VPAGDRRRPFIGQVLMSLIMPALSLGIYNGCKAVAEGRKAGPDILLSGFRQNLPELVKIGGIYFRHPRGARPQPC